MPPQAIHPVFPAFLAVPPIPTVVPPPAPIAEHRLQAIQHIRRMRGGSQAQLMRGSDNRYHVIKLLGNPQHDRVLANDFFASRLGQRLELPMPDVAVIEVSAWLIENAPDLCVEVAGWRRPFPSGLHLASQLVGDPFWAPAYDYLPESQFENVLNRTDISKALVLDKWTGNADGRQVVFTQLIGGRGYTVYLIDQGYSFNAGEWDFPDLALHGVYYRNYMYRDVTSRESFEPALTLAEEMEIDEIWRCAEGIPEEWCLPKPRELPKLVETLYHRRSKIRDLIAVFRDSSRNPFPNWKGR